MSVVVCDSSPLHSLILREATSVLPGLFASVLLPPAVWHELQHPHAPVSVRTWSRELSGGNTGPLGSGEWRVSWMKLKGRNPEALLTSREEARLWHQREMEAGERAGQAAVVAFHRRWLADFERDAATMTEGRR